MTERDIMEKRQLYWMWIDASYSLLRKQIPNVADYESDLERAYGSAKQIVMELWAIRSFFKKIGYQTILFDQLAPDLKAFRDAIAHVDERVDGNMVIRGRLLSVGPSRQTLAGGLLSSEDGINWKGLSFCYGLIGTESGLWSPLGLVRNWIITNTASGAVEMQLDATFFKKLEAIMQSEKRRYEESKS